MNFPSKSRFYLHDGCDGGGLNVPCQPCLESFWNATDARSVSGCVSGCLD